ncbi:MAG: hypothetical protein LUH09_07280 [Clostridiales bacterium]|nr:hypothetical protein [Clostridiales bacterium]
MKKPFLLLLTMTFCLLACAGCSGQTSENAVDTTDISASQRNTEGIALSDNDVTLELAADETEVQITQDYLSTNTAVITVSADSIPEGVEIQLYLYSNDAGDEPIMYATLTDSETSFVFSGLTHALSYKVGAETDTLTESLSLTITD